MNVLFYAFKVSDNVFYVAHYTPSVLHQSLLNEHGKAKNPDELSSFERSVTTKLLR